MDKAHSFVLGIHPRVLDYAAWCVAGTPGSGVSSGTTPDSGMLLFKQAQLGPSQLDWDGSWPWK
jgi:hypothetical protein